MLPQTTVKVLYPSDGMNQLGDIIGKHQPGDVANVHVKASFVAKRHMLKVGGMQIGKEVPRKQEFLSTHIVGDTAFFQVPIKGRRQEQASSFEDILAGCIAQMKLGETCVFSFDLDEKIRQFFVTKLHKGHYKKVPDDAMSIRLEIDSFRSVRGKTEHRRPNRNGTGASMPGSFVM